MMRKFITIVESTEGDVIQVGKQSIQPLTDKNQLMDLLERSPYHALRGWVCTDGSVLVWDAPSVHHDAPKWSHRYMGRHIPGHRHAVYFWRADVNHEEFRQHGGRRKVINCEEEFLFHVYEVDEARRDEVFKTSPLLAKIIKGRYTQINENAPHQSR